MHANILHVSILTQTYVNILMIEVAALVKSPVSANLERSTVHFAL